MQPYHTYRLVAAPHKRPTDLHKHLAQYRIASTVRSFGLRSDGVRVPRQFRSSTGADRLTLGGVIVGMIDLITNAIVKATSLAVFALKGSAPCTEAQADVRLVVPPQRADWSELVLCKWVVRNGWEIAPVEGEAWIDPVNLEMACNNPAPPLVALHRYTVSVPVGRRPS